MKAASSGRAGSIQKLPPAAWGAPGSRDERAAGAIDEAVRHFERLTGDAAMVSLVLDADARIAYCNNRLLALTGWRRDEVEGQDYFATFLPEQCYVLREAFSALLKNDPHIWSFENDILTRAGTPIFIRWSNAVVRSSTSEIVGTASVGQYIIERRAVNDRAAVASNPQEILTLALDLIDDPESTALPFVRMIAEHCAQLASDCGATAGGEAVARHIRDSFRI